MWTDSADLNHLVGPPPVSLPSVAVTRRERFPRRWSPGSINDRTSPPSSRAESQDLGKVEDSKSSAKMTSLLDEIFLSAGKSLARPGPDGRGVESKGEKRAAPSGSPKYFEAKVRGFFIKTRSSKGGSTAKVFPLPET